MNNLPIVIIILIMLACKCGDFEELSKKETPPTSVNTTTIEPTDSGNTSKSEDGGKVNSENFKKLKNGMTYKEVVEILGGEGNLLSESEVAGYKTEVYQWKADMTAGISLVFQNDKLFSKSQYGLE